jgi:integrase
MLLGDAQAGTILRILYAQSTRALIARTRRKCIYMTNALETIGNQIDVDLHNSAPSLPIPHSELRTVQDLLAGLQENIYYSMLKSTAGHISDFLKVPLELLEINALVDLGPSFRLHLKERRYKVNAVRSYSNFLAILLKEARQSGWEPRQIDIPEPWKEIFTGLAKCQKGFTGIIRFAIRRGERPSDLCEKDFDDWYQQALARGRAYVYVRSFRSSFKRAVLRLGLADRFPKLSWAPRKVRYGIPVRAFPTPLREEVQALLKWKQDPYAEGRPRRARHRAETAHSLEKYIARFYGFVTNVQNRKNVTSLIQLVNRESVVSFLNWALNERKRNSTAVVIELSILCAAMRWNPAYKNEDFSWFRPLISQISPEPESEKRERKARKYLPYEAVAEIPALIRGGREAAAQRNRKQVAIAVRDELFMSWIVTLPWRQRNIRECQLERNLFRAELPTLANIARPEWVQQSLLANPHEEFWQFYFREDETKTGQEVRSVLPHRLVPLLEEYIEAHRPLLVMGSDPGNLFLNCRGGPLTRDEVIYLVSRLTIQYKGRRVTPHLFRDIFAYWWLENHPQDYLTLSKVLWHRDIKTTLRIYGSRFDESHGVMRVEEWLDRRAGKSENIMEEAIESPGEPRLRLTEGHGLDYKMEYEEQRKIAERLTDRVEQLEKQLGQRTLRPHSEQSQLHLRIRPGKVKAMFRKTGPGAA